MIFSLTSTIVNAEKLKQSEYDEVVRNLIHVGANASRELMESKTRLNMSKYSCIKITALEEVKKLSESNRHLKGAYEMEIKVTEFIKDAISPIEQAGYTKEMLCEIWQNS